MSQFHVVTGGAGCIGSDLVGALLAQGHIVRVIDNLSSGRLEHLDPWIRGNPNFKFFLMDVLDLPGAHQPLVNADMVWHLTAKTDIKFSEHYDFAADFRENTLATWVLLEAMRAEGIKKLAFSSSAAVYGEASILDEDFIPEPVSLYGATKLACEAMIRAMALRTGLQAWMFRYCSIVSGKARKSGNMVVPDLLHKLRANPKKLQILGDGNQTKPSLLVSECVDAMLFIVSHCKDPISIFNVGTPDAISVTRQAELIVEALGLKDVEFQYTGGKGGWPGDVPSFRMHTEKLGMLGWRAQRTSEEAVKAAIQGLLESGE